jgi:hypothetical protein
MTRCLVRAVVLLAAVACAHDNATDPVAPLAPGVITVSVSPSQVALAAGAEVQLVATVSGAPGNDQRVRWSLTGSASVFVSPSGMLTACWPGGHASVIATSLADTTASGGADVVATSTLLGVVSIASISYSPGGAPANLDSLAGSVIVVANVAPVALACYTATEVDLVVSSAHGDTVVARQPFATPPTGPVSLSLPFNSAAATGGQAVFPNGSYAFHANAVFAGLAPVASNMLTMTIRNP